MNMTRSTYYYEANKPDETQVVQKIEAIVLEWPKYGYRRVTKEMKRRGTLVNHKVVLRLMRERGILCKQKKSFKVSTTDSKHPYPVYPNLIKNLVITRLNQVWIADITYVALKKGFAYLAAILDLLSRKVIGYAMSKMITKELALEALRMAITRRNPAKGCIHHSDRGVQYASHDYVDVLKMNEFQISMSRKGNPYDNATAESFMKTYKYEEVYLSEYQVFEDAMLNSVCFIEDVYNAKRLHSSLGYVPPNEFEETWLKQKSLIHQTNEIEKSAMV
jgi:transposase InsO family protein